MLRPWRAEDRAPFLAMSRDPQVMAHLGDVMDETAVDAAIARTGAAQAADGHSFWAIERRADAAFLGFCGLKRAAIPATPIDGEIEIGWRLRADAWGQGYAREAAAASLSWGWENLAALRIVAITVTANRRSWDLMGRLGMMRRPDLDFGHPAFATDHALHRHIVHTADRPAAR